MKSHSAPLLILLVLFFLSCSKPETPEQVLKRLMDAKMKDGKFVEPITPGTVLRVPSSNDGVDYSLEGKYRMRNDQLIVTISESEELNQRYFTGIFRNNDSQWESLFNTDLVSGKLDTLLDLNGDNIDEFILDEYEQNSAGFDSYQFLYAKKENPYCEKIDKLSRRFFGGNAYQGVSSDMSFEKNGAETVLTIQVLEKDFDAESNSVETAYTYTLRWQPPNLIKEKINLESQRDMVEFSDPLTEDLAVAGLLTKWFPVTESDGKLKRQQVCGAESFIEIISGEQHTWREQGYQDVWEASIEALRPIGEGGYFVTLKLTDGSKKEIKFERNLEIDFVYTIDGRNYTSQPDKFEISNSTEDCGN